MSAVIEPPEHFRDVLLGLWVSPAHSPASIDELMARLFRPLATVAFPGYTVPQDKREPRHDPQEGPDWTKGATLGFLSKSLFPPEGGQSGGKGGGTLLELYPGPTGRLSCYGAGEPKGALLGLGRRPDHCDQLLAYAALVTAEIMRQCAIAASRPAGPSLHRAGGGSQSRRHRPGLVSGTPRPGSTRSCPTSRRFGHLHRCLALLKDKKYAET